MVNIQTVISISKEWVITHKSFDDYWKANIEASSPENRVKKLEFKNKTERYEQRLAAILQIDPQITKNLCFIFGSVEETRERIKQYEIRQLLFNRNNTITLQTRFDKRKRTIIIATVHLRTSFQSITTVVEDDNPEIDTVRLFED